MTMSRRCQLGLISSTRLLPTAIFLAITRLVSETLDLNEFIYHDDADHPSA